jgi:hypothetical protein
MISAIKVLNSVTALGTDVSVGSDGIVNIASVETVDAYNLRGVSVTVPQTEVLGIVTITPTAASLAVYNFYINAFSLSTGLPKVLNVSFTSASGADATTISNQARAIINADTDLSVIASGTATIVLTAKATQPFFVVGGLLANVDSYSSASATTIATNLSAANGTAGRAVRGSVAYLQNKYAYSASGNALNYNELALLTSGFFYTEVVISYITTTPSGSGAFKGEISTLEAVVLVRANSDGSSTFTTTNYADLLGSYGTITGLSSGYRVSAVAITGTAGTNTTNVQTITSGVLGTEDVVSGDYIIGDTGSAATNIRKVISVLSQTTFLTTTATAITGSSFRVFRWRNLPV